MTNNEEKYDRIRNLHEEILRYLMTGNGPDLQGWQLVSTTVSLFAQLSNVPLQTLNNFNFFHVPGDKQLYWPLNRFTPEIIVEEPRFTLQTRGSYHHQAEFVQQIDGRATDFIWGLLEDYDWGIAIITSQGKYRTHPQSVELRIVDFEELLDTIHLHQSVIIRSLFDDIGAAVKRRIELAEEARHVQLVINSGAMALDIRHDEAVEARLAKPLEPENYVLAENGDIEKPLLYGIDCLLVFTSEERATEFAQNRRYHSHESVGPFSKQTLNQISKNPFRLVDPDGWVNPSQYSRYGRYIS